MVLHTGPGKEDDVDWEKRTGGVEGPVLSAFKPITANAVKNKVRLLSLNGHTSSS